jgi:hypothetical protein
MTISNKFNYVLINNDKGFVFRLRNSKRKLYLYDENRFRLYNPVFWMEVSVNSAKTV